MTDIPHINIYTGINGEPERNADWLHCRRRYKRNENWAYMMVQLEALETHVVDRRRQSAQRARKFRTTPLEVFREAFERKYGDSGKAFKPTQERFPEGHPLGGQWKDEETLAAEAEALEKLESLVKERLTKTVKKPSDVVPYWTELVRGQWEQITTDGNSGRGFWKVTDEGGKEWFVKQTTYTGTSNREASNFEESLEAMNESVAAKIGRAVGLPIPASEAFLADDPITGVNDYEVFVASEFIAGEPYGNRPTPPTTDKNLALKGYVFDILVNNTDRHTYNLLVPDGAKAGEAMFMIDHGRTFADYLIQDTGVFAYNAIRENSWTPSELTSDTFDRQEVLDFIEETVEVAWEVAPNYHASYVNARADALSQIVNAIPDNKLVVRSLAEYGRNSDDIWSDAAGGFTGSVVGPSERFDFFTKNTKRKRSSKFSWRSSTKAFNPNQPRYPKGHPKGGQWMEEGSADYKFSVRFWAVLQGMSKESKKNRFGWLSDDQILVEGLKQRFSLPGMNQLLGAQPSTGPPGNVGRWSPSGTFSMPDEDEFNNRFDYGMPDERPYWDELKAGEWKGIQTQGNTGQGFYKVTDSNGKEWFVKQLNSATQMLSGNFPGSEAREAMAEAVASKIGRKVGLPMPAVEAFYDADKNQVLVVNEFIDGESYGNLLAKYNTYSDDPVLPIKGIIFDTLIGNGDRHQYNIFMSDEGEPLFIDHGFAFRRNWFERPTGMVWSQSLNELNSMGLMDDLVPKEAMLKFVDEVEIAVESVGSKYHTEWVHRKADAMREVLRSPVDLTMDDFQKAVAGPSSPLRDLDSTQLPINSNTLIKDAVWVKREIRKRTAFSAEPSEGAENWVSATDIQLTPALNKSGTVTGSVGAMYFDYDDMASPMYQAYQDSAPGKDQYSFYSAGIAKHKVTQGITTAFAEEGYQMGIDHFTTKALADDPRFASASVDWSTAKYRKKDIRRIAKFDPDLAEGLRTGVGKTSATIQEMADWPDIKERNLIRSRAHSMTWNGENFNIVQNSHEVRMEGLVSYGGVTGGLKFWARSSNDEQFNSLTLQETAAEMTGRSLSPWQQTQLDKAQLHRDELFKKDAWSTYDRVDKDPGRRASRHYGLSEFDFNPIKNEWTYAQTHLAGKKIARETMIKMYNETQQWFQKNDIEIVRVFRGFTFDPEKVDVGIAQQMAVVGNTMDFNSNPLESWSFTKSTVEKYADRIHTNPAFSGQKSVVVAMDIPVERILSTPLHGFGTLRENEVVVLSPEDAFDSAMIVRYDG